MTSWMNFTLSLIKFHLLQKSLIIFLPGIIGKPGPFVIGDRLPLLLLANMFLLKSSTHFAGHPHHPGHSSTPQHHHEDQMDIVGKSFIVLDWCSAMSPLSLYCKCFHKIWAWMLGKTNFSLVAAWSLMFAEASSLIFPTSVGRFPEVSLVPLCVLVGPVNWQYHWFLWWIFLLHWVMYGWVYSSPQVITVTMTSFTVAPWNSPSNCFPLVLLHQEDVYFLVHTTKPPAEGVANFCFSPSGRSRICLVCEPLYYWSCCVLYSDTPSHSKHGKRMVVMYHTW